MGSVAVLINELYRRLEETPPRKLTKHAMTVMSKRLHTQLISRVRKTRFLSGHRRTSTRFNVAMDDTFPYFI